MAEQRTYTGGRFQLDIAGYNVAYLKKFSGLAMEADIATNDLGTDNQQKKHVANFKWTGGKATVGIGMGKGMNDWIAQSFSKGHASKDGQFTSADFDYRAQSKIEFYSALITGVTVPKLSGDSKDAAYFDIEFEPERVKWSKGGGEIIQGKLGQKQKQWLCSNFRIEVGKLPTTRVASIDSFTWKCAIAPDQLGGFNESTKHPAKVTTPDLKLAISYADHQAWADWAYSWFIGGNRKESDEVDGAIIFLGPNLKDELGRIDLKHIGIKKFSDDDAEANSEKIKRFNVELYCEKMVFNMKEVDA
ncbi:MAG: phage tail protein [Deltaproteobacteria bacterium]|nr:phage tail protein [Deltaproteobacteria bacterium]